MFNINPTEEQKVLALKVGIAVAGIATAIIAYNYFKADATTAATVAGSAAAESSTEPGTEAAGGEAADGTDAA